MLFCASDLDLDLMTLMYELEVKILKMCLHSAYQNELSRSRLSKVKALETDRQINTHTDRNRRHRTQCHDVIMHIHGSMVINDDDNLHSISSTVL